MATSGSTSFNPTRDVVVRRALRMVGAFASTDNPRPEQLTDAFSVLNTMIKAWQVDGFTWTYTFAELTLVQGQSSYDLGLTSTDTCVYQGTVNPAARPIRIFSATRKDTNDQEVPLDLISRDDYQALNNKTTQGRVNQIYYDPQIVLGKLYVWPTPDASGDVLVLNMDRPLQDMTSDADNYDFPQEWIDVLSYGLALRLAPEYGLPISERQLLAQELVALKSAVLAYDRGDESVFLQAG